MEYEDFFIIPITEIDVAWSEGGFSYDFHAEEYCEEMLDIPAEHLEETLLSEEGLEIKLVNFDEIGDEDWFIQLRRLSKY